MGCGCNDKAAVTGKAYLVKFSDGTQAGPFPDETSARVAMARTGKGGRVEPITKAPAAV